MINEKEFKCSVNDYISNEKPICREERQYALFLNNILYKYKKPGERCGDIAEVFKACHIPSSAEIINVFYEATFMRDIFERDRTNNPAHSKFNDELIKYVQEKNLGFVGKYQDDGKPYNLGSRKSEHGAAVRSMMNSKPDIAVIYREEEKNYLLFLECKYLSEESGDGEGNKQTETQWRIADFLCQKCFTDLEVSPAMENERSCKVCFGDDGISIKTLIELNDEVFK